MLPTMILVEFAFTLVYGPLTIAATGAAGDPHAQLDGYRAGLVVPVAGAVLALAVTLPGLRAGGTTAGR